MFDAHCHLTYPGLCENVHRVLEESRRVLLGVVTCGLPFDKRREPGFAGAKAALELADKYKGFVFVSLGLHPTQVAEMSDAEIEEYKVFIQANKERVVAIGEIGLDAFLVREEEEYRRSKSVFLGMLELAEKLGKAVVIHSRKAEEEAVDILSSYELRARVLMHSFTGNMTAAKKALDAGFYFSVNYKVKDSKNMRKIAKNFSLERILTETDAPFLAPDRGLNTPMGVRAVVEEMARLRGMPAEEIDRITTRNAVEFYGLKL